MSGFVAAVLDFIDITWRMRRTALHEAQLICLNLHRKAEEMLKDKNRARFTESRTLFKQEFQRTLQGTRYPLATAV